jgi:Mg2+/Co2+ transporter CorB
VAGLVLERLEHIPAAGESLVVDGVLIEVVTLDEWAITELRLSVAPTDEPPDGENGTETASFDSEDETR